MDELGSAGFAGSDAGCGLHSLPQSGLSDRSAWLGSMEIDTPAFVYPIHSGGINQAGIEPQGEGQSNILNISTGLMDQAGSYSSPVFCLSKDDFTGA